MLVCPVIRSIKTVHIDGMINRKRFDWSSELWVIKIEYFLQLILNFEMC